MKTANCPTCGAPVTYRSVASIMAVCEYCRSTLIRRGSDVENIGKMAELLDDASLIQLGSEGTYKGMHFAVVGRIQLQYAHGVWNEWHLLFDNQRSGWLSDGNNDYTVTFLSRVTEPVPALADLSVGMEVPLNGESFTVTDIEHGKCIAGAGELMFKVGAGFEAPSADLRSARSFASIDYSEEIPLLFLGVSVNFNGLHLTNLRDSSQVGMGRIKLDAIQCPACASTIEIHAPGILSAACGSCHALVDTESEHARILEKFSANRIADPFIALGVEGKLNGVPYRVIGFLRRTGNSDGESYLWDEYLLHNSAEGFRWLSEYQGHWTFSRPVKAAPRKSYTHNGLSAMLCEGRMYRHFEESTASVSYVLGEFYWRVSTDEMVVLNEYVDPPLVLSEERGSNEITWTVGEYTEPEVIKEAFALEDPMPERIGVAPNQPWKNEVDYGAVWRSFMYATLIALVVQLASVAMADNRSVYYAIHEFPTGISEGFTTPVFEVTGRTGNLHLINVTDLVNSWIFLDMELVARDTGKVYAVRREVSYYSGSDSDGSWTEGSNSDDAQIANVPPGHYFLSVDTETPSVRGVKTHLKIKRNVSNWHNFFIIEGLLLLLPLIYWWRRISFESRRWENSNHGVKGQGGLAALMSSGDDE